RILHLFFRSLRPEISSLLRTAPVRNHDDWRCVRWAGAVDEKTLAFPGRVVFGADGKRGGKKRRRRSNRDAPVFLELDGHHHQVEVWRQKEKFVAVPAPRRRSSTINGNALPIVGGAGKRLEKNLVSSPHRIRLVSDPVTAGRESSISLRGGCLRNRDRNASLLGRAGPERQGHQIAAGDFLVQ